MTEVHLTITNGKIKVELRVRSSQQFVVIGASSVDPVPATYSTIINPKPIKHSLNLYQTDLYCSFNTLSHLLHAITIRLDVSSTTNFICLWMWQV